jgi:hypothetical protein
MKRLLVLVAVFAALTAGQANAAPLTLGWSGVFGAATTIGGNALGADTPFSFEATFDPTADLLPGVDNLGVFDAHITFTIGGTTYTVDPSGDVAVSLSYPLYGTGLGTRAGGAVLVGGFNTATPDIDVDNPGPTTFSNRGGLGNNVTAIPLLGAGDLLINELVSVSDTTEITPAPEPATMLLLGTGAVGVVARRRMRKGA